MCGYKELNEDEGNEGGRAVSARACQRDGEFVLEIIQIRSNGRHKSGPLRI